MNSVENGKQKTVDFAFLLAVCQKCQVSADYILGLKTDFRNHENQFVSDYTGLDETAVIQLHKWNKDRNNEVDLSILGRAFRDDEELLAEKAYAKQTGTTFLRIINYLFKEGELPSSILKNKTEPYSNLLILHSLYLLCMAQPKVLTGAVKRDEIDGLEELLMFKAANPAYDDNPLMRYLDYMKLDGSKLMVLEDENNVFYPVSMKEILEQIARRKLDKGLENLIASVNQDAES